MNHNSDGVMMRNLGLTFLLLTLAAVLAIACGGGDDPISTPPWPELGGIPPGGDPQEPDIIGIPQGEFVIPSG